ncbi:MAG: SAM-dependent methyltransferase [Pirellulaceae bacterium]|nr:SAM-dependent methyltransferase [Pirellulaceae bacterium]
MKSAHRDTLPIDRVIDALGPISLSPSDVKLFVDAMNRRYRSSLRRRRDIDPAALPFDCEPIDWYSLGHRVTAADVRPSRHLAYACGDYYLQDAGSMLALAACDADQNDFDGDQLICDLCAAPGGKASGLLEAIGSRGFLLANEPIRSRIAPLAFNLARTRSDRFAISCMDSEQLADTLGGVFDLVVVDAPCSGQALMGKGKQTVSALSPKQIQHSAARQRRILAAAIRLLRPGGRLVYSTCTFAHAENEAQIDHLVSENLAQPSPVQRLDTYASGESTYRIWPHQSACAGSFAASVRTTGDVDPQSGWKSKIRDRKRQRDQPLPFDWGQWYEGCIESETTRCKVTDAVVYAWPADAPLWVEEVAVAGPEVAYRTGQTWKPSHAGALRQSSALCQSGALRQSGWGVAKRSLNADTQSAKAFLAGAPITCDQTGWLVVRYQSKPLGWIKASQGVGKNQLPTAARFAGELTS